VLDSLLQEKYACIFGLGEEEEEEGEEGPPPPVDLNAE